ncbi:NAD(P)-binding protein [Decorospora gaudefroyi]|uniref:NAD(P)-binding protein n=1 Tax=Decorospora gaudefroyi TaxID=184978 RepID=A0A6A5KNJ7_9PLEO|nr:NAD(P)-binding protein [Decorospora gaudefroyi]
MSSAEYIYSSCSVTAFLEQPLLHSRGTNGIGLDTVIALSSASPKYHVIIGARNLAKGETVLQDLQSKPTTQGTLSLLELDMTSDVSIAEATKKLEAEFNHLDVLINNAGICPESGDGLFPTRDTMRAMFETNVYGPTILTEALIPLLKRSSAPRVVNVSSTMGSIGAISDHGSEFAAVRLPGYRMSKAALNMLTAYQYFQLKGEGFRIWSFCPGYVVTDLGRDREDRVAQGIESSETSAQGLREIVEGKRDGEVGGFLGRRGDNYEW